MIYYLYQITNTINNKIYIGVHQTNNLDDGYMGSGKLLKRSQQKYGLDNFEKKILRTFDNPEDMFTEEAEIVTSNFLLREDVYNLKEGGLGGWSDEVRKLGFEARVANGKHLAANKIGLFSDETEIKRQAYRQTDTFRTQFQTLSDASQSESAKQKRKSTMKTNGHAQGEKNSQFGSMWITNGKENRKIKKDENIPIDWKKGRYIKSEIKA
jgi:hypothetical protein